MNVLQAAEQVLTEAEKPLHYQEITKRMLQRQLWTTQGKTPDQTVSALCWLLGTSVHKIGESDQYNRSYLPSCHYEKAYRSGNSRTGKPMLNEHTYVFLINQVEK